MNSPTEQALRANLGRVDRTLAESLAWLNSPAAIAGEIARLEAAQHDGDDTERTRAMLRDWRAVRQVQATIVTLAEDAALAKITGGRRRIEPDAA